MIIVHENPVNLGGRGPLSNPENSDSDNLKAREYQSSKPLILISRKAIKKALSFLEEGSCILIPHALQLLRIQNRDLAAAGVDQIFVLEIGQGADHGLFGGAHDAGQVLARDRYL